MSEPLATYQALVVDTKDPQARGRVITLVPSVLGDARSEWCEPSLPQRITVPNFGDIVYVHFIDGDLSRPVYSSTPLVDSTIIKAGSINNDRLAGSITNDKLAGSITNDKLAGGITNDKLAGGITADKLAFTAVTDPTATISHLAGNWAFGYVDTSSRITVTHNMNVTPLAITLGTHDSYRYRLTLVGSLMTATTFGVHVTDYNNVNITSGTGLGFWWIAIG